MPIKQLFTLIALALSAVACNQATPTPTNVAAVNTPTITTSTTTATATNIPITNTPLPPAPTPTPTPSPTPVPIPESVIEMAGVTLPLGFSLIRYADMARPTGLAFDADGRLHATSQDGTVRRFEDEDGDGRADRSELLFSGFTLPLGLAFQPETGDAYLSSSGRISILRDTDGDGTLDTALPFVSGLPFDRHQNNNPKFGPDGRLYLGIGSTCDVCYEADERSATIMRFDPATAEGEIIATGLRNAYDIAFHPETGALFATENGRDDLGDNEPPEELNHIIEGANYGFPDCWGQLEGPNCTGVTQAIAFFQPHASANSLVFYTADRFPPAYRNNLFVLNFGSFLVEELSTGLQRVQLTPDGETYTAETEWFLQFPPGVYPLALTQGPDGALYLGDYINGGIWRVSYGN